MATVAELLRVKGVPNIIFWGEDPSVLVASHFSALLFSSLATEGHVSLLEAYALALFATQVRDCACVLACTFPNTRICNNRMQALRSSLHGTAAVTVARPLLPPLPAHRRTWEPKWMASSPCPACPTC